MPKPAMDCDWCDHESVQIPAVAAAAEIAAFNQYSEKEGLRRLRAEVDAAWDNAFHRANHSQGLSGWQQNAAAREAADRGRKRQRQVMEEQMDAFGNSAREPTPQISDELIGAIRGGYYMEYMARVQASSSATAPTPAGQANGATSANCRQPVRCAQATQLCEKRL